MTQDELSKKINRTQQFVSAVLRGVRRPSWPTAKALAEATGTDAVIWVEADPAELRRVVEQS